MLALPGIRSLRWRGRPRWPPQPLQCSTPESDTRGTTSIVFGENQLFPDLFSLSPLATAHPLPFQREWVRPSTRCYPRFSLAMARSSGFGSTPCYSSALFGLAFAAPPLTVKLATERKSLTHYTKGTQSPQLNRSSALRCRICFHPRVFCRTHVRQRTLASKAD